ncbi:MAG: DUF1295 domain-containing protein [Acholeplasmatales bacterium]|nr:DUF1295 domain-containing protein [Acholeplasmatales bacterium]
MNINKKKLYGLVVLLISYITAYLAGFTVFNLLKDKVDLYVNLLLADLAATVIIYLIGLLYNTASIYDPYWSLQSIVIGVSLVIYTHNVNAGIITYLVIILMYSARLTGNFIIGFNDISYIDWRYKMLKEKSGKLYFLVNLFGIHIFPTLVVYAATLPMIGYIRNNMEFKIYDIAGLVVMVVGIIYEIYSDLAMIKFKKERKSNKEVIDIGLWRYSRHPNYFGEIVFWFGVFITFWLHDLGNWYFMFGAVAILLMFIFISIPMQERHLEEYKRDYRSYKRRTRMLIPLRKRNN